MTAQLVLASTSPRRRQLLDSLGLEFTVEPISVDEAPMHGESAENLVIRLAESKAMAARGEFILGADTVVVLDDQVLGKPRDEEEAVAMLLALSSRDHQVLTGVALRTGDGLTSRLSRTTVQFREIGRDEALRYWQSGEPADKAGGYGIQGLGGMFVTEIRGSYTGVMGLPIFETAGLLCDAGIEILLDQQ